MKKPLYKQWWLWAIVVGFLWGFIINIIMDGQPSKEVNGIAVIPLVVAVVLIYMLFTSQERKQRRSMVQPMAQDERNKKREAKAEWKKEVERERAIVYDAYHQTGLPLSEGAEVQIERDYGEDDLIITGGGNTFRLAFSKITDMTVKTDVEIQKSYVSSVGGAVGGAVLFGPLGAMIGGRAKEKKSKTTTHYLIITYLKDGEVSYIGFDVSRNVPRAQKLIEAVSPQLNTTNGQTIEL